MSESRTFYDILNQDGFFAYKTKGISMRPLLRTNRDIVVIKRKEERCKQQDIVLFVRENGQYVLHRALVISDDGYYIAGDNCVVGEWIKEENVIGIVSSIKRNGHVISTSDIWYRIYVNLWCRPWRIRMAILKVKLVIKNKCVSIYHMIFRAVRK